MAKRKISRVSAELKKLRNQVRSAISRREKKGLEYGDLKERVKSMSTRELKRLQSREGEKGRPTYKGLERARKRYEKKKQKEQFNREKWYRENFIDYGEDLEENVTGYTSEEWQFGETYTGDYEQELADNFISSLIELLEQPIDETNRRGSDVRMSDHFSTELLSLVNQKIAEEGTVTLANRLEGRAEEIADLITKVRESYYTIIQSSFVQLASIINGSSLSLAQRIGAENDGYWENPS